MPGESQMPVIHFLMEFRLRPLAGAGEDWVSLVIPYNAAASIQSYLLRGLTPGMDIRQHQPWNISRTLSIESLSHRGVVSNLEYLFVWI